ncbi:MAG: hypothetical protein IH589_01655 [Anaerolineales bacterium]|nr:hypothetical protein [Anaerolineales bacterium]
MNNKINLVVLAITKDQIPRLSEFSQSFVLTSGGTLGAPKYGDHSHEWSPFGDDTGTIGSIISSLAPKLASENLEVQLQSTDFLKNSNDESFLIKFLDEPCVYIIDCLALEIPEIANLAVEIDRTYFLASCITPVSGDFGLELRDHYITLRNSYLKRLRFQYEECESPLVRLDVTTKIQLERELLEVIRNVNQLKLIKTVKGKPQMTVFFFVWFTERFGSEKSTFPTLY